MHWLDKHIEEQAEELCEMVTEQDEQRHLCLQCGKDMGFEYLLGVVCGKCCRRNHRRAAGTL